MVTEEQNMASAIRLVAILRLWHFHCGNRGVRFENISGHKKRWNIQNVENVGRRKNLSSRQESNP